MPYYRFTLNVPAEPAVIAERLRKITGYRYDRWIDSDRGPAFFGRIKDNSFRMRRNIGAYRNSFLPRIRGQVTPDGSGTRVNVSMRMNPLVLAFMVLWCTGMASGAWISLQNDHHAIPIPAGMLLFGVCLSVGSFYWEAEKARTLLSNAVMNMTADRPTRAEGDGTAHEDIVRLNKSYGRAIVAAIAALTLIPAALTIYGLRKHLKECPAFRESLALATHSPEARRVLGDHIEAAGFARGCVQNTNDFGYAMISIPVRGSRGKGTVHLMANRVQGRWDLERFALWTDHNKQRIDMTPATRHETFRYPGCRIVYLVPLDNRSAEELKELPAYYAARLGLRVIALPVMHAGPEVIAPGGHQVSAERAADYMERNTRKLNRDVDAVFIGVTDQDFTIESSGWPYATNYRSGTRFAIVSTARLHDIPVLAGANPEVFPVRVRKMVTKNLALLCYPLELSADPTSALATSTFTANDVDEMSEEFLGEFGKWTPAAAWAPCFSVIQGSDGKQAWKAECGASPPNDNRFETFNNYTYSTSLVLSRTDFPVDDERRLSLLRKYWERDDAPRTFGVGGNSSFSIFPVGDSQKFSWIDLVREDGGRISFRRKSWGTGYANARFQADWRLGDPFSKSNLEWNGNGWDLKTIDDWTYRFPSSGPGRSAEQGALTAMIHGSTQVQIQRNAAGAPWRIAGLEGASIDIKLDANNRIIEARHSSGHTVRYEYGANGRLARVDDSETGDESYDYDQANRLTAVRDSKGAIKLSIAHGDTGEITAETLTDHRIIRYAYRFNSDRTLNSVTVTDDHGYVMAWIAGRGGFYQTLPIASGR
ncbi:MAG TPA: cytochrome c oxidase assembly factor Coa1 family protein [Bryobacteraceae bacterium]|jgi:YD repeat-containing protein|nr:cytochrome c oxidase assembly factor Coa1 family protein [Bryobacteraceae bacterium]